MNRHRRTKLIAALFTLLFHGALLALLFVIYLRYSPSQIAERTWPPVDEDEILYGGEYVMIGEEPTVTETLDNDGTPAPAEASQESNQLRNSGEPQPVAPAVVTSERQSDVKIRKPDPQPAGPSREELARQEQQRREREAAERIAGRVNFGAGTSDADNGKRPGSPNGNSTSGALSGAPGTDLHGRSLASWSKPSGNATGTIVILVHVNRKGKVTSAAYASGTGAIAANAAARRSCEQAALRSAFSVSDTAPADQVGRITYRFE